MANQSSPVRNVTPLYPQHHRKAVQNTAADNMETISPEDFFHLLKLQPEMIHKLKKIRYNDPPKENLELDKTPVKYIKGYGDFVSSEVRSRLAPGRPELVFGDTGHLRPGDHPTSTGAKPDITIVIKGYELDPSGRGPNWSDVESLSEIHSKGTRQPDSIDQAYAYTAFLLQSRPDKTAVLTFWAGRNGMCFIMASAMGYRRTPVLAWHGEEGRLRHRLFCAFVYRLYQPHPSMLDHSVKRIGVRKKGTGDDEKRYYIFHVDMNLKQDTEEPKDAEVEPSDAKDRPTYYVKHVGHPVGRRSIVYMNFENPITVNGMQVDIIKEQYIPSLPARRFQETDIIQHIHEEGLVPGVVQMICYEEVKYKDGKLIKLERGVGILKEERTKVRIAECNMGESFVELKTPRDMLIAAYDTLAITRYLFSKRGVLHRDISKGNVVCISDPAKRKQPSQSHSANRKPSIPASDLCCATYVLGENKHDCTALLATLIDYDHGEILNKNETKSRAGRTGTAVFIARAVLKGIPIRVDIGFRSFSYPRMPDPPDRYRDTYPDRMIKFPIPTSPTYVNAENITASQLEGPWRHELRHDAESIFWLMFYWIVLAWPEGEEEVLIPSDEWSHFTKSTAKKDYRCVIFNSGIPEDVIHPFYASIKPLFQGLWSHIQFDQHFAPSGPLRDPEYVHEAFQRCILSFLIEHDKSSFMMKEKRDVHRQVEPSDTFRTEKSMTAITNTRFSTTRGADPSLTAPIPPYTFEPEENIVPDSQYAWNKFQAPSDSESGSESLPEAPSSSSSRPQPSRSPSPERKVAKKSKRAPALTRRQTSRTDPPKEGGPSLLKKARKAGKAIVAHMVTPAGRKRQNAKRTTSPKDPSSAPSQVSQPSTSQLTPQAPTRRSTRLKRDAPDDPPDESTVQPPKKQRRQPKRR